MTLRVCSVIVRAHTSLAALLMHTLSVQGRSCANTAPAQHCSACASCACSMHAYYATYLA